MLTTAEVAVGVAVEETEPKGLIWEVEVLTVLTDGRASENVSVRRPGPSGVATRPLTLPSSTPRAAAIAGTPITIAELWFVGVMDAPPVPASTSLTTSPTATPVAFSVMDTVALVNKRKQDHNIAAT